MLHLERAEPDTVTLFAVSSNPHSMSRDNSGRDLLIIDGALSADSCSRAVAAMDAGTPEAAEVLEAVIARDDAVRRAAHIEVDEATIAVLEACVESHRPPIERFFELRLGEREGLSVLRYGPGDFFRRHRDWGVVPSWPDAARRRISVVLFLTTSLAVETSGTFSGGALRLFEEDGSSWRDIHPRAGTLVAFPSTAPHEVTPVVDGIRAAVVDWFYGSGGEAVIGGQVR
jgi:predicted 2-oxoglutarate/Fe(II)-dependent dioxygenase YbiX